MSSACLVLLAVTSAFTAFAQTAGDRNHTNGNTTRTQTTHVGEPSTTHPGGNPGRTTGTTRNQSPFVNQAPTQDSSLYPACLYSSAGFNSRQVVRLVADTIVQSRSLDSYNCFAYAETFILGKFPTALFGGSNVTLTPKWLSQHNFSRAGMAGSVDKLPAARLGDLVLVQNKDSGVGSFQWYHVAVVVGVDGSGRITRLRQKPDANRCVIDTTPAQFTTLDPVRNGEQYELWRDPSLPWSQKLEP